MPNIAINFVPSLTGENTNALVNEQNYTYNQTGFTFNQATVDYGGVYKSNQDIIPEVSLASYIKPQLSGGNTDALLLDQGYTYNQTGFSFNQANVDYGGIYNYNFDIVPVVQLASLIAPSASIFVDWTQSVHQAFLRLLESGDGRLLENGNDRLLE